MDWNNVNVFEMEEGVGVESTQSFYVQPHQAGAVAVVSGEDPSSIGIGASMNMSGGGGGGTGAGSITSVPSSGGVEVIPTSSNVVFRTLEGFAGEDDGVEVIGILEEGQQLEMLQNLNQMGVSMTNEEFLAQLQSQGLLQGHGHHSTGVDNNVQVQQQQVVMEMGGGFGGSGGDAVIVQGVAPPQEENIVGMEQEHVEQEQVPVSVAVGVGGVPASDDNIMGGETSTVIGIAEKSQPEVQEQQQQQPMADVKCPAEEMQIGTSDADESIPVQIQEEPTPGPSSGSASMADVKVLPEPEESPKSPECILPDLPEPEPTKTSPKGKRLTISSSRSPSSMKTEEPSVVIMDTATGETVAVIDNSNISTNQKRKRSSTSPLKKSEEDEKLVEITISSDDSDNDDEDFSLLNDVDISEVEPEVVLLSSDEDDDDYISEMHNAIALHKLRQPVDISLQAYRPKFYSRELLHKKHPKYKDLTFREIMQQALLQEKVLPDLNEQPLLKPVADKLRSLGHLVERDADGGCIVHSRNRRTSVYYCQNSSRLEPVLSDPVLENYVQVFRKSIARRMARQEVDPSSVIPASIGSTGSSSIGSETDPECLATDEEESESELLHGSVAAWIIPDSIPSRTPSPEPDFDEPQFITTTTTTTSASHHHHPVVRSHGGSTTTTIVEGPPTKKRKQKHHEPKPHTDGKIYPKPAFSYSCLIAMALKNSKTGSLPVSEIYKFMCDHFPYFKSAPSGWKNSVRHNLSLNKCFEKIEKPGNNGARKGCLWALNPAKIHKMDEEVQKWSRKDPLAIRRAMSDPENLGLIEKGELKRDYSGTGSDDDEDEDFSEPATPLTPSQVQARRSRTNSSDSTLEGATAVVTPVVTTVSQVHAALQRSVDAKSQIQVKREDNSVDLGTITNIQGNYVCHTPTGNGTYTLSFANIGSSSPLTPIIIRRTPTVK